MSPEGEEVKGDEDWVAPDIDPRKLVPRLPEYFFWSRRILNYESRGQWCLVYEPRFISIVGRAPPDGWSVDIIKNMIKTMEHKGALAQREVYIDALNGPMAGSA